MFSERLKEIALLLDGFLEGHGSFLQGMVPTRFLITVNECLGVTVKKKNGDHMLFPGRFDGGENGICIKKDAASGINAEDDKRGSHFDLIKEREDLREE